MDISELHMLSVDKKIEIIGKLWDDIADSDAPFVLSPAVQIEIDRRRAELSNDPSSALDRDEMWRLANESRQSNG